MKKNLFLLVLFFIVAATARAEEPRVFRLATSTTDLVLQVTPGGRLVQTYFGKRLRHEADIRQLAAGIGNSTAREAMSGSGNADYYEPAVSVVHNDGNPSTILKFVSHEEKNIEGGTEHVFRLKDEAYPFEVDVHYAVYPQESVYKQWSVIRHAEKRPVTLRRYASSMLHFYAEKYYLTNYGSDWAKEAQPANQPLLRGKKVIDTKLGARANMVMDPFFELGLDGITNENHGTVLLGTLGWTGNFSFTFEVDHNGCLRLLAGINPYASDYSLARNTDFRTPDFIFTLSLEGTGFGSRSLHNWARNYSLKDGKKPRLTLLNNWENTYFNFDQAKLAALMKEAKTLGVDLFLLDDGWFGNKHPRNGDTAGLGDWEANRQKLPGGIPALVDSAKAAGVKFGIWIEPEMVNPKSELYEKHPDWVIEYPNRETYYYRNQLVLDLGNPDVQEHVYGVVENIMKENPDVAFFKWDCNSPITNIYSHYLKDKQQQLYVNYVRGLYNVLERIKQNYPDVPMMLCSGGGGRCDYEALRYFTEFWPSDNTDPVERLYIQWNFSKFFPPKAMCAHVTSWNRSASVKFRTDVAAMCKLGFDIGLKDLSEKEIAFCQQAVANWKRLQPATMDGAFYRLVSPHESNHMAVNYVSPDARKAVLFAYDIHPRYGEHLFPVKLQGLDPDALYRVEEINLMPGARPSLRAHGRTFSGHYLMTVGLSAFSGGALKSRVVELTAE